jgi:aminopeptidase N
MRLLIICLVLNAWSLISFSQSYDPIHPPNSYQSLENPNYWKNRKPYPGYWQQDVHYTIDAKIDERTDIVSASEQLTYWNNSPDTLRFVFFHLYQNAFQPGSYCSALHEANDYPIVYGPYEKDTLGTVVKNIMIDGKSVKTQLDNTILKVFLNEPLLPNSSISINLDFKTYFDYSGSIRRRMKEFGSYGSKHFDGVHWYPRMAVYDRKFGWCTDQHLGKEFYGDFGTYDVALEFSDDFVVEATGFLQNREEVLPDDLRKKLDISNFANKPWEEKPSIITPYNPAKRKTWKYHAENVHDFAWTADPNYRIGEANWNGVQIISLVQEPHASRWQNAASYTAKIIETYSRDFGMYVYNKMVVADARDGMEYPMLTLDGGSDPGYRGLLAHEVGHNWFFGMVGNNETYRAALDEGFTQFLTVWALEHIDGPIAIKGKFANKYTENHTKPEVVRYKSAQYGYLRDAIRDDETTLNTHSDDFEGAVGHGGGYGNVYYKTATMLFNLQYTLGDTLFSNAMKNYFNEWKIAHPYFEDFRNSIIHYTKMDLNWFFDQWIETSKTIDYKVKGVNKKGEGEYQITFKRKGSMQMPIDFSVYDIDGKRSDFYIPNTWFEKSTKATKLPRWIGWGIVNQTYTANIKIDGKLDNVVIDTSGRLADVNRLDNSKNFPSIVRFDARISNTPDWHQYEFNIRPDAWYNFYDGVKLGFHVNGNYMNYKHVFDATFWLNSGFQKIKPGFDDRFNSYNPFSFKVNYSNPTNKIVKGSSINASARYLDGLAAAQLGFNVKNRKETSDFYAFFKSMYRPDSTDIYYLINRNQWTPQKWNNTLNVGLNHYYDYKRGEGFINMHMRTSGPGSDYDYTQLSLTVVNKNVLGKFNFNTRFFAQIGTGSNLASESALYLAGANQESMMDNKFMRSAAFFPQDWGGFGNTTNHLQYGGGLNLRGYSGYLVPFQRADGTIVPVYKGNSGAAVNAELEFDRLFPIRPKFTRNWLKINTYLFADAGFIQSNLPGEKMAFAQPRADAGVGVAFTIKKWGPLNMEKPLTFRFDMPLLLTNTPDVSPDFLQFRWVVGVNRAF